MADMPRQSRRTQQAHGHEGEEGYEAQRLDAGVPLGKEAKSDGQERAGDQDAEDEGPQRMVFVLPPGALDGAGEDGFEQKPETNETNERSQ